MREKSERGAGKPRSMGYRLMMLNNATQCCKGKGGWSFDLTIRRSRRHFRGQDESSDGKER